MAKMIKLLRQRRKRDTKLSSQATGSYSLKSRVAMRIILNLKSRPKFGMLSGLPLSFLDGEFLPGKFSKIFFPSVLLFRKEAFRLQVSVLFVIMALILTNISSGFVKSRQRCGFPHTLVSIPTEITTSLSRIG